MRVVSTQWSVAGKGVSCITLGAMLFALYGPVGAQQPAGIPRIGYLLTGFQPPKEFLDAMRSLGYVEGKNFAIEYRAAEEREERLAEFAMELVKLRVEIIVAPGSAVGLAANKATKTIPVVYFGGGDPIALGLVDSLARPGGNVTGITSSRFDGQAPGDSSGNPSGCLNGRGSC